MKVIVYTAAFGPRDDVIHQPPHHPDVRYVAYTEQDAPGWEVRPAFIEAKTPRLTARLHKCLSHRLFERDKADVVIWADASHSPSVDMHEYALKATDGLRHDFCTFKHLSRVCLYQEIRACVAMGKDNKEVLENQGLVYLAKGYPHYNGLCETGVVVRRHTDSVKALNELWWSQIQQHSCRDQVSLPYVLWHFKRGYRRLPGWAMAPDGFKFSSHCFRFR